MKVTETAGQTCITTKYWLVGTFCKPRKFSQPYLTETRGGNETVSYYSKKLVLVKKKSSKAKKKRKVVGRTKCRERPKTCREKRGKDIPKEERRSRKKKAEENV